MDGLETGKQVWGMLLEREFGGGVLLGEMFWEKVRACGPVLSLY